MILSFPFDILQLCPMIFSCPSMLCNLADLSSLGNLDLAVEFLYQLTVVKLSCSLQLGLLQKFFWQWSLGGIQMCVPARNIARANLIFPIILRTIDLVTWFAFLLFVRCSVMSSQLLIFLLFLFSLMALINAGIFHLLVWDRVLISCDFRTGCPCSRPLRKQILSHYIKMFLASRGAHVRVLLSCNVKLSLNMCCCYSQILSHPCTLSLTSKNFRWCNSYQYESKTSDIIS